MDVSQTTHFTIGVSQTTQWPLMEVSHTTQWSPISSSTPTLLRPAPISHNTFVILEMCVYMLGAGSFATFGLWSNVVNVVVFLRQGILTNSSIVCFTSLAVSDFICCLVTVVRVMSMYVAHFSNIDRDSRSANSVSILVTAYFGPFVEITCWTTATMSLERVVSILFPFRFKTLITPARSLAIVTSIWIGTLTTLGPAILFYYLAWTIDTDTNTTYLDGYKTGYITSEQLGALSFAYYVVLRFLAILIVIMCNTILWWKVSLSQKFRKKSTVASTQASISVVSTTDGSKEPTQTSNASQRSLKDMKLLRMITVVSSVFTVCYIVCVPFSVLAMFVWHPDAYYDKLQKRIAYNAVGLLQVVNSSTNMLIYYNMSSRYKQEFRKLFCR